METNKPEGDARAIKYTSSATAIATVNDAGVVSFVTPGTVTITATKEAEAGHAETTASYILYITMKPSNKQTLVDEITRAMNEHGNEVDLNYIDTSVITNMNWLFGSHGKSGYGLSRFNGDISGWDVSKVTTMLAMFYGATAFDGDISRWKVSKVTNMNSVFYKATAFNQDISGWDVSKVTTMSSMFFDAKAFKQNLDAWGERINPAIKANSNKTQLMFYRSGLARVPSWCKSAIRCF